MRFVVLVDCTDKCIQDNGTSCRSTSKDEIPEPRGSLANDVTSHAIKQANQEV